MKGGPPPTTLRGDCNVGRHAAAVADVVVVVGRFVVVVGGGERVQRQRLHWHDE